MWCSILSFCVESFYIIPYYIKSNKILLKYHTILHYVYIYIYIPYIYIYTVYIYIYYLYLYLSMSRVDGLVDQLILGVTYATTHNLTPLSQRWHKSPVWPVHLVPIKYEFISFLNWAQKFTKGWVSNTYAFEFRWEMMMQWFVIEF